MDVIGPLQLRVMHHIWRNGPCTVHTVHDALNSQAGSTPLAYTTILTVMRNLTNNKKLLTQTPQGRSHLFTPTLDERSYKVAILRQVRKELFAGDARALVDLLAQDEDLDEGTRVLLRRTG